MLKRHSTSLDMLALGYFGFVSLFKHRLHTLPSMFVTTATSVVSLLKIPRTLLIGLHKKGSGVIIVTRCLCSILYSC